MKLRPLATLFLSATALTLTGCINTTSTAPKAANHIYLDYDIPGPSSTSIPEIVDFAQNGSSATLNDVPEDGVEITTVATGPGGYIYAALYNFSLGASEIVVFSPGAIGGADPIRRFHSGLMTVPIFTLTVDPSGNVYAYDYLGILYKFTPFAQGIAQPLLVLSGIDADAGMTTDAQGNFYIAALNAGPSSGDAIYVYAAGFNNATPQKIITPAVSEFIDGLAVDASGTIYASGELNGGTYAGRVEAYASTATGNATPIRTITGVSTLLTGTGNSWNTMAIDATGTLYVRSLDDYAPGGISLINEFPSTANGNVAPVVSISAGLPLFFPNTSIAVAYVAPAHH